MYINHVQQQHFHQKATFDEQRGGNKHDHFNSGARAAFNPAASQQNQLVLALLVLFIQGLISLLSQQHPGQGNGSNDVVNDGPGDDDIQTGDGDDVINVSSGQNRIDGGQGNDSAVFSGRPLDHGFEFGNSGELQVTNWKTGDVSHLTNIENLRFGATDDKNFTPKELVDSPFLTGRRNISIFGDTTLNRLVVMNNEDFSMIQDLPVPGGQDVYSVDYVTADKGYITPRSSNFIQELFRNPEGVFELGERIPLDFNPRTPNRNDHNGLVLYSGADRPMWALIDYDSNQVVAQGGRNEVTQGTFDNYDSKWATGHAQWVSDTQFLIPDRQSNEISLYSVENNTDGSWDVAKTSSVTLPESVHTFLGTRTNAAGEILTLSPGEGTNANNNADAHLYELKIADGQLSVNRQVNTAGGLHHPGTHPDGKVLYVPTSNATLDIVDRESFEVIKTLPAGQGAGHVTFIPERNLALVNNHQDEFVTAIDTRDHSFIKNIPVTTDNPNVDSALQAHTARVSEDRQYYLNFSSDQGTYFRIDLNTLELDGTVFTGGTPRQASQPGELGDNHAD